MRRRFADASALGRASPTWQQWIVWLDHCRSASPITAAARPTAQQLSPTVTRAGALPYKPLPPSSGRSSSTSRLPSQLYGASTAPTVQSTAPMSAPVNGILQIVLGRPPHCCLWTLYYGTTGSSSTGPTPHFHSTVLRTPTTVPYMFQCTLCRSRTQNCGIRRTVPVLAFEWISECTLCTRTMLIRCHTVDVPRTWYVYPGMIMIIQYYLPLVLLSNRYVLVGY